MLQITLIFYAAYYFNLFRWVVRCCLEGVAARGFMSGCQARA